MFSSFFFLSGSQGNTRTQEQTWSDIEEMSYHCQPGSKK
jgi:hypothetical protein